MRSLALFVVGLCLLYATGAAKIPSGAPVGNDSPAPAPGQANKVFDLSNSGDPPAFTEVLRLVEPDLVQCARRFDDVFFGLEDVAYMASKDLKEYRTYDHEIGDIVPQTYTWLEARNQCRKRCMDLVTLDTWFKFSAIAKWLKEEGIPAIWTSGRMCDLKGCDKRPDLQPLIKNGWYWASKKKLLSPTDKVPSGFDLNPWSHTGHFNQSQPDQAELKLAGKREGCIALMDNFYNDGVKLHDVACYQKKQFACEDSPELVEYMEEQYDFELPTF